MDKGYCAVRMKRMLENINIIHKIQTSEEFKDFYKWLDDFYSNEIQGLYNVLSDHLSIWQYDYQTCCEYQKLVKNYIFDCIQYGRDFTNRGDEQLLIRKLGNDRIVKEVEELRIKFINLLREDNKLRIAYEKLTEFIDIRYLVVFHLKVENLLLTWVNISNFFHKFSSGTKYLSSDEILHIEKFNNEINDYLHDFEIVAQNKSYKIGHITIQDPIFFDEEKKANDYLTLRLAEDFRVPLVDTLLDFLEFAKFKIKETPNRDRNHNGKEIQLEEIQAITELLNKQKNKRTPKVGAGAFSKLCLTIYNLLELESFPTRTSKNSERIKKFFDFLAHVLKIAGVKFSYNATETDSAHLELNIFYTEHNLQDNLRSLYDRYIFNFTLASVKHKDGGGEEDDNLSVSFTPFVPMTKDVKVYNEEPLLTVTANSLDQLIRTDKKQFRIENLLKRVS